MDDFTLDQVRSSEHFDFSYLFDEHWDSEYDSSTFFQGDCNYYSPHDFNNLLTQYHSDSCISALTLNCQSLTAHWHEFNSLIAELSTERFSFDFIGLTEIFKLKEKMAYELEGYHELEHASRNTDDDGRGGVGLFIKENISYHPREDLSIFIPHIIETFFIEIGSINTKGTIIGVIYRPNTYPKADIDVFNETLRELLSMVNREKKSVILMGDMNVDLLHFDTNEKTNIYLNNVTSNGLLPIITRPTRVTNHSATLIDHIITNKIENYISGIILTDIADHFGAFGIFKNGEIQRKPNKIVTRIFNDKTISKFKSLLTTTDFTSVRNYTDVNTAYEEFLNLFHDTFDRAFPKKEINPSQKYTKHKPWFTEGLLNSLKTKSVLYKKKLKSSTDDNINNYKAYCRVYNQTCRRSRTQYYFNLFNKCKNNIRESWTNINKLIKKAKNSNNLPSFFLSDNKQITDKLQIAQEFNNFFSTVGEKLNKSCKAPNQSFAKYLQKPQVSSFFLQPVTTHEVLNIVKSLKNKYSYGFDEISTNLIKSVIQYILEPLTFIFNLSLESGTVPDKLKIAKVIPIFKSGNKHHFTNYRPISLLPCF